MSPLPGPIVDALLSLGLYTGLTKGPKFHFNNAKYLQVEYWAISAIMVKVLPCLCCNCLFFDDRPLFTGY